MVGVVVACDGGAGGGGHSHHSRVVLSVYSAFVVNNYAYF